MVTAMFRRKPSTFPLCPAESLSCVIRDAEWIVTSDVLFRILGEELCCCQKLAGCTASTVSARKHTPNGGLNGEAQHIEING